MLGHGFHPPEAQQAWSNPIAQSVHPQERTPFWSQFCEPIDKAAIVLPVLANEDRIDRRFSCCHRSHAHARSSGIYAMQRFARTIRQDLEAVRNAVLEPWSNGQTERQINKLKTLNRAMYGRADVDLLRARMLPLQEGGLHQE
jgi:Transposase